MRVFVYCDSGSLEFLGKILVVSHISCSRLTVVQAVAFKKLLSSGLSALVFWEASRAMPVHGDFYVLARAISIWSGGMLA